MVHPDRNPQDPLANDKTRSVIAAYELLTAPKYRDEIRAITLPSSLNS